MVNDGRNMLAWSGALSGCNGSQQPNNGGGHLAHICTGIPEQAKDLRPETRQRALHCAYCICVTIPQHLVQVVQCCNSASLLKEKHL